MLFLGMLYLIWFFCEVKCRPWPDFYIDYESLAHTETEKIAQSKTVNEDQIFSNSIFTRYIILGENKSNNRAAMS